jgi:hypothetical protein
VRLITVRRQFTEGECFPFFWWGDWHVFNAACAKHELRKDRQIIADDPNSMYANMGDNGDFIGIGDKRFKAEHLDPDLLTVHDLSRLGDVEIEWLADFEKPVVSKCVVQLGSNHSNTYDKQHQTNVMRRKLEKMGGDELRELLWAPGGALVRIVFTDAHGHACTVVMNLHHGTHTAKYAATLLNQLLVKARYWPEVDILARGHCHYKRLGAEQRMGCDRHFHKLTDRPVYVVLTGGYLKTFREDGENYAEDMDLDPIDIGMARANIYPSRYGARIEAVA